MSRGFLNLLRSDREFGYMVIIATSIWIYTSLMKFPFIVPSNYSDVGWLWFRDVKDGGHNMAFPSVDYKLEYPPIIGLIIWLGQAVSTYWPFMFNDQFNTYMVAESVLQFPFVIGTLYNTYVLCKKLGVSTTRIYLYMLTTLTFVIYGFYNWDFIVAYFATLAILFYVEKRYNASSIALTFGILSKFIPVCMALPMVACLPNNRARAKFIGIAALIWGGVNTPLVAINYLRYGNLGYWLQLFTHTSQHQLQNTWVMMLTYSLGLGDAVSGRDAGHIISLLLIIYLIVRSLFLGNRTPLEKILMSWYAWFGAIYLFDPQMVIQLFPIFILTPNFNFLMFRIADLLNGFIIVFYFIGGNHPEWPWYLKDQLAPFGLINVSAALRQLIVLGGYFFAFGSTVPKKIEGFLKGLLSPITK